MFCAFFLSASRRSSSASWWRIHQVTYRKGLVPCPETSDPFQAISAQINPKKSIQALHYLGGICHTNLEHADRKIIFYIVDSLGWPFSWYPNLVRCYWDVWRLISHISDMFAWILFPKKYWDDDHQRNFFQSSIDHLTCTLKTTQSNTLRKPKEPL